MRRMASYLLQSCVLEAGAGGFITNGLQNAVDTVTSPDFSHLDKYRKLIFFTRSLLTPLIHNQQLEIPHVSVSASGIQRRTAANGIPETWRTPSQV